MRAESSTMELWIIPVVLGPIAIVGMFALISMLISAAGWQTLTSVYDDRDFSASESWLAPFVSFGWLGQYRGVVRIETDPIGVRFSVLWLFKAGHRPFVVPWGAVAVEDAIGWYQEVTFMQAPDEPVHMNQASVERMETAAGRSLRP